MWESENQDESPLMTTDNFHGIDRLGRAIPHRRLFTVIGRKSHNRSTRHLLQQYMSMLRELLLANKAPVVIATVHDIGYALCEIAENPRHTSNNGVSRLAQTVRHWRIAAGLTQTAVAKQSGVNRSYLSHLESGRRNPTLATLQRLAKILNVAPGYFLCRAAGSDGASLRPALDALER
jgi:DNA-binding XRE family transcriptional regulator